MNRSSRREPFEDPTLVGRDGRRVAVVDVQRLHRRARKLAGQGLGELVHVDRPRAGRGEVGPGQAIHREVVGPARREQRPAAVVPPGADDRRQAGDRPHGHPAAPVPLEAVVQPDQRRMLGGVTSGEGFDRVDVDAGDRRDLLGRILLERPATERVGPDGRAAEVVVVLQPVAPDHVHQAERQGGVGAGAGGDVPVGPLGGRAPVGVDRDDRRAALAGFDHQRPEVAIRDGGVRAPVEDQLAPGHGHRVGARPAAADRVLVADPAGRGADGRGRASRPRAGGRTGGRGCSPGACPSCRSSCRAGSPGGRRATRRSAANRPAIVVDGLVPADRLEPARALGSDPPERTEDAVLADRHGRDSRPSSRRGRRG